MLLDRQQIIDLIQKLRIENLSEEQEDAILEKLEQGVLDPEISDYIYWSKLSAEQIADKVLSYKPINL